MAKSAEDEAEKVRRLMEEERTTLRHLKEDGAAPEEIERQEQSVRALQATLLAVTKKLRQAAGGQ